MLAWWRARAAEVAAGARVIVMQFGSDTGTETEAETERWSKGTRRKAVGKSKRKLMSKLGSQPEKEKKPKTKVELVGYVMLQLPDLETGPFRAEVEKLLLSPQWRRMRIASALMQRLEEEALRMGRSLLVSLLDLCLIPLVRRVEWSGNRWGCTRKATDAVSG